MHLLTREQERRLRLPPCHLPRSWYAPWGNVFAVGGDEMALFRENVHRTPCQAATADDWCSRCRGGTSATALCTACFPRSGLNGGIGDPITLDPKSRKVSGAHWGLHA